LKRAVLREEWKGQETAKAKAKATATATSQFVAEEMRLGACVMKGKFRGFRRLGERERKGKINPVSFAS